MYYVEVRGQLVRVSSFLIRGSGDQTQIMLYGMHLNRVSQVSGSVQKLRYITL